MTPEIMKALTPNVILVGAIIMALCGVGVSFLIKWIWGALTKVAQGLFSGSDETNVEVANGLFKFSKKGKGGKDKPSTSAEPTPPAVTAQTPAAASPTVLPAGQFIGPIAKNNIINCMTQSIDEVIQYYTETNEIKNQLLKSQLATTKRILNPIAFTFTQAYKTDLEKKHKDDKDFDIRYDDSSWFFGKLVDLDFETIIMKELDDAYSRNHLSEKNEEDFQTYSTTIARRCVKAFEASVGNYHNPVDLTIARVTFEDNKDELFKQINACIADAKRQSEENKEQILIRNSECNKKLSQIMTINIPEIKASDIGVIVGAGDWK